MGTTKNKRGRPNWYDSLPDWAVDDTESNSLNKRIIKSIKDHFRSQAQVILQHANRQKISDTKDVRDWIKDNCADLLIIPPRQSIWKIQARMEKAGLNIPAESTLYRHINHLRKGY
jgi:hypothetical protein